MNIDGERELVLAFNGDDMLPLLKRADLRLINLECVIAENGKPGERTPKVFFFRADPHAIDVLKIAGIDYVSLANNHSLDFGEDAMLEMLGRLDKAGIAHAGGGQEHGRSIQTCSACSLQAKWCRR